MKNNFSRLRLQGFFERTQTTNSMTTPTTLVEAATATRRRFAAGLF